MAVLGECMDGIMVQNEQEHVQCGLMTSDPREAQERKKAAQTGKLVLVLAVVFLVIAFAAVLGDLFEAVFGDLSAVPYVAMGISISLLVVGLMILFAGERQRRRDAARRMDSARKH